MPGSAQRYIGGAVGFAFAAVWVTAGLGSALVCMVAAVIGYAAVRLSEGRELTAISAGRDAVRELQNRRGESAPVPPRKPSVQKPSVRAAEQVRRQKRVPARAIVDPEPATYGW
jgi:hypothetical protein